MSTSSELTGGKSAQIVKVLGIILCGLRDLCLGPLPFLRFCDSVRSKITRIQRDSNNDSERF